MNESIDTAPATEPDVLAGRYELAEIIGRGGMAEVYRATDLKLSRPVAVKILLDSAGDETDRARFIAEARTLAAFSHSGLVTILDAGFGRSGPRSAVNGAADHDQPFLVLELVDGPTLAQLMSAGPMTPAQLGGIAAQIAEALAYVHASGIVHRDVKPGNVLIGPGQTVKLADFGIARLVEQRTRHTATGLAIGTAAYIAPEQVSGGAVEGPADVYALGLVLLEALTGRREYAGPPAEAALARLNRAPTIPTMRPAWQELLRSMTALDPKDRPSAAEVATVLRANLDDPAPVATVGIPDAATSPILAVGEPEQVPRPSETMPMSGAAAVPPQQQPRTSAIDRAGDTLARQARLLLVRIRSMPAETRGVTAALGALVLLLVVMAVASGEESPPDIPDNTPAELREPLTELHDAVNGDDE